MTDRYGQRVFIAVSLAVMCVAAAMFFFAETPTDDAKTLNLRAQVIIPRASSNRKSPPARSAGKQTEPTGDDDDIWQLIYDGGRRIGFSRTTFRTTPVAGETKIHSSSEVQMSVLRFRRTLRLRVKRDAVETPSGDLLSFRIETGSGGSARSIVTGRVAGNRLIVETKSGGITKRTSYPWRAGIKSPAYQHRLFRSSPMKPGEIRRFETFLPRLGRTTEIRLAAESYRRVRLRSGKHGRLLRVRITQSIRPAEFVYVYLDERGRPAISKSEFAGKSMVHYTVSTAEAMNAIAGAELDIRLGSLIRTSFIKDAHRLRKIVYRIQRIWF